MNSYIGLKRFTTTATFSDRMIVCSISYRNQKHKDGIWNTESAPYLCNNFAQIQSKVSWMKRKLFSLQYILSRGSNEWVNTKLLINKTSLIGSKNIYQKFIKIFCINRWDYHINIRNTWGLLFHPGFLSVDIRKSSQLIKHVPVTSTLLHIPNLERLGCNTLYIKCQESREEKI